MAPTDTQALIDEAASLGLFKPHGAFEVHCSHCHARLNGQGDCSTCGLIGRPPAEIEKRARTNVEAANKLLATAIQRRKAYRPVGGKADRLVGGKTDPEERGS